MDPTRKTPPAPFPAAKPVPPPPVPAIADPADQSAPINVPKAVKKWAPLARTVGPALVAVIVAITDGRVGKHEISEKTDTGYETLAPSTIRSRQDIKALKDGLKKLTDTVELQGRLLLAMQPGFTPAGVPAPAPATPLPATTAAARRKKPKHVVSPADPKLVADVQANTVKTAQEIKQRVVADKTPAPALPPAKIPENPPPPVQPLPTEPPPATTK